LGNIDFSVIIPTRNRPKELAQALQAISETTFPPHAWEVIVVADGRGQGLEHIVSEYELRMPIRVIEQDHQGPGAARNAGAACARGRHLAFTDDDCLPTPGWLDDLKEALDRSPGSLVGGRTTNRLSGNVFSETSQLIHQIVYRHYNSDPQRARFLASNNLALRAEDFAEIGGFDPAFRLAAEDREFCDRWLWSGRPMHYEENAEVHHAHALTLRAFCEQHFRYGRGAAKYHRTRSERGSGRLSEHLSFHGDLNNWLTPPVAGGVRRQLQVRALLLVWQVATAAGYFWEKLTAGRRE
jgi:glycosyltransferase involved in cell wall biosynthesis